MWRPFPLFPILFFFSSHREEIWITPKFSVVSRCVFRGGCDIIFWCLLHKWSRLFVFFLILRLMMGWDRSCAWWMDGKRWHVSFILAYLADWMWEWRRISLINQSINREMKCGSPGGDIWLGGRVCSLLVQRTGCGPRGMPREAKRSIWIGMIRWKRLHPFFFILAKQKDRPIFDIHHPHHPSSKWAS